MGPDGSVKENKNFFSWKIISVTRRDIHWTFWRVNMFKNLNLKKNFQPESLKDSVGRTAGNLQTALLKEPYGETKNSNTGQKV